MNELINKIGKVEQLELFPAEEFAEVPDETLAEWINTGHSAIKMAVRRLAIHVAQVGAWLVAAKDKCQHGEWLNWLLNNCPLIAERTARRYMDFYDKVISNRSILTDLNNMTPVQGYRAIGVVIDSPYPEIIETPPIPEGKYRVIYADPPWQYSNAGLLGAAERHLQHFTSIGSLEIVDDGKRGRGHATIYKIAQNVDVDWNIK